MSIAKPLYISAADREELAQKVRDEFGLVIGPDRLDPALRRPNLPSSMHLENGGVIIEKYVAGAEVEPIRSLEMDAI